jgi:beta-N-acetylhexosaminidase
MGLDRAREVSLDGVRAVVGDTAHVALARTAAERGLTLVKDSLGQLPIAPAQGARATRVLSVSIARRTDLAAGTHFDAELRRRVTVRGEPIAAEDLGVHLPRLVAAADSFDVVVVSSYMGHAWDATSVGAPRGLTELVRQLGARRRAPILLAMGNPYLLRQLPQVPAYLVTWSGSQAAQQAAALALLGERSITGVLPITIPGVASMGTGLRRDARR